MSSTTGEAFSNHIWFGGEFDAAFERNVLPYLARHDFSVVLTDYGVDPGTVGDVVRDRLATFSDRGIDVWLGAGIVPGREEIRDWEESYTDRQLLSEPATMERFLDVHRRVAETYREFYPEGKLVLWHEEPTRSNWTGETRAERAESMAEYGPEIFAEQKRAVADVAPDLEVGIFPHWTVMADPAHTSVSNCEALFDGMREVGVLPDFTYVDAYRGYYEWGAGYEPTDEFVASVVANVKTHGGGRPVYYLGEAHTINNNYTPSRQAILGNFRGVRDAGADSVGWYVRSRYRPTGERNYNPYVPNVGSVDEAAFNSLTGSRDRIQWANLLLVEERPDFDAGEHFDLWVHGHDIEFYEHAVVLRTADGEWEFVADVSGYVDGENPYAGGGRHGTAVVHALERDRYLDGGTLGVRIESRGEATLEGVYATPYFEAGVYRTEPEVTALVEDADLAPYVLGSDDRRVSLSAGATHETSVPVTDADAPLHELVYPDQYAVYERLRDRERAPHEERVDLWVYGRELADVSVALDGEAVDAADPRPPEAFDGPGRAVVYRGLERGRLGEHPGGEYMDVGVDGRGELLGVYAMPDHGARNFTPDVEAARIVARDYRDGAGQIENFCVGRQTFPGGRPLPVETWVHVPNRRAVAHGE